MAKSDIGDCKNDGVPLFIVVKMSTHDQWLIKGYRWVRGPQIVIIHGNSTMIHATRSFTHPKMTSMHEDTIYNVGPPSYKLVYKPIDYRHKYHKP